MRHCLRKVVAVAILSALLTSCSFMNIKGSFDDANQKEGGPSGNKPSAAVGGNVGIEWMWGAAGYGNKPIGVIIPKDDRVDHGPVVGEFQWDDQPDATQPSEASGVIFGSTLEFAQKGSKGPGYTSRLNFLEATGDVLYAHRFSAGGVIYGGLGPYVAYGVGGKSGNGLGEVPSFSSDGYKRFDAGLNLEAGYRLSNSLQFTLRYEFGLADLSTDPSDYTSRNRSFSINVGYSIKKIIGAFKSK
jgi:Outer membrane protein beta-barrel domain